MTAPLKIYEKLDAFYLGRGFDLKAGRVTDQLVLYDSKDLVTHAMLVGMTGSGKTGLGVVAAGRGGHRPSSGVGD